MAVEEESQLNVGTIAPAPLVLSPSRLAPFWAFLGLARGTTEAPVALRRSVKESRESNPL